MARVLVTGISGQDGSYLAELLRGRGDEVFGIVTAGDPSLRERPASIADARLLVADLRDSASVIAAVERAQPEEVYNLAAASQPARSWDHLELACDVVGMGVARLLGALRVIGGGSLAGVRMCQASSSEMFGVATDERQDEQTPLRPRSPYGSAKAFAHNLVGNHREARGLFGCCAILFNHESPRRPTSFVTRKITRAAAEISLGLRSELRLGTMDSRRDWGHAADYVRAMTLMLGHATPGDYVVASGVTHSIADLLAQAFASVGVADWSAYVVQDPDLVRPAEPDPLCGDARRAREVLGWAPSYDFETLVEEMVQADLQELRRQGA